MLLLPNVLPIVLGSLLICTSGVFSAEVGIVRSQAYARRGEPIHLGDAAAQPRLAEAKPRAKPWIPTPGPLPEGLGWRPGKTERLSTQTLTARRPVATSHSSGGPSLADLKPSPLPTIQFPSIEDDGTSATPDTAGAVGPYHVLTVANTEVRVQDREGAVLASLTLDEFFSNFGSDIFTYDPRCVFDAGAGRWILTAAANPNLPDAAIVVAVSASNDPLGDWFRYYVDVDSFDEAYADSPTLGFNKNWIVVQANLFHQVTGTFIESEVFAFDKLNWYEGADSPYSRFHLNAAEHGGSQVPAVTMDSTLETLYLVKSWNGNFVDPQTRIAQGLLRIYELKGSIGAEELVAGAFVSTVQESTQPVFTWADSAPTSADLGKQAGTTNRVQLGDSRMQSVMYRGQTLWCSQTVLLPTAKATRSGVVWWEVFPDGQLFQRHLVDDPQSLWSYAYPSLAVNDHYDVLVGYNGFGASSYPTALYRFYPNDGVYNNPLGEQVIRAGEGSYLELYNEQNRWGDWSATCIDPLNDGVFWTLQEYALAPSAQDAGRWGLAWAAVTPPYDLQVSSRASTNRLVVGQEVTWTLSLSNRLLSFAYNVTLTNPIPAGLEILSASSSAGEVSIVGDLVYWDLLRVGVETNQLEIIGRATGDTLQVTNRAGVVANGQDSNPTNNVTQLAIPLFNGSPVFSPVVKVTAAGPKLLLSWPVGYLGFVVETRKDLSSGKWEPHSASPSPQGAVQSLELPTDQDYRYFRLRRAGP
jgi:uncharacterized repeat protein (TIGR01451 family)